ncbi:hypothetical protein Leryth_001770, partial [Lithospermum erythrorhizon]
RSINTRVSFPPKSNPHHYSCAKIQMTLHETSNSYMFKKPVF